MLFWPKSNSCPLAWQPEAQPTKPPEHDLRFVIRCRHWQICEFAFLFVKAYPDFTRKKPSYSHSSLVPFQRYPSMIQMHHCYTKCSCVTLERRCSRLTPSDSLLICIQFSINITIFRSYFLRWLISYNLSWQLSLSFRRWETVHNKETQLRLSSWFRHLSVLPG